MSEHKTCEAKPNGYHYAETREDCESIMINVGIKGAKSKLPHVSIPCWEIIDCFLTRDFSKDETNLVITLQKEYGY